MATRTSRSIVAYDVKSGDRAVLAQFDPALFVTGGPVSSPRTRSRAASSMPRASSGRERSCSTRRCTARIPIADKVEHGQLMTLEVRDWKKVFD